MDTACSKCGKIYTDLQKCPSCNIPLTRDWSGKVAVMEPERSRISKEMGLQMKGLYALKT